MARYIGALLLAALVLWTGEALGACAWVLWGDVGVKMYRLLAYETRTECEREARRSEEWEKAEWQRQDAPESWRTGMAGTRYQCWPDTVDPRAPKGAE